MREHREEIELRRRAARSAHSRPMYSAMLLQLGEALGLGVDRRVGRRDVGDGHVRPPRQLAAVLEREVEERGEHHRGELDGDAVDPVERLAAWQPVEHTRGALANGALEVVQVLGGHDRGHHAALLGVLGRVHADEARPAHVLRLILDLDPAELAGRGVDLVVHLDGHDVLELRDRPVRPVGALRAVVDRRLAPQPREVRPPDVFLVETRVGDVERLERQRVDLALRLGPPHSCPRSLPATSRRSSSARSPPTLPPRPAACPGRPWRTCR